MGTDIHLYVELRSSRWDGRERDSGEETVSLERFSYIGDDDVWPEDGPWICCAPPKDLRPALWDLQIKEAQEAQVQRGATPWELGRNYTLFSILANVRNNRSPFLKYISTPRGLPDDISDMVKKEADYWDRYAHDHSWLLLSELERYPWPDAAIADWRFSFSEWGSILASLREYGSSRHARIVFWFDS